MTTEEYKLQHPEHSHLQGNELWDAMEDSMINTGSDDNVFRWKKGDPDIELSAEDEEEYQKSKEINKSILNYTRIFWKAFDKQQKITKPLSTVQFIIFDVSENDELTQTKQHGR